MDKTRHRRKNVFCCDYKKYLCDICVENRHMTEKEKSYLIYVMIMQMKQLIFIA